MKLELSKETAKKIYKDSPDWLKEILEENFDKESLLNKQWKDFKTFDDLCRAALDITGEQYNKRWEGSSLDPSTLAFEKMKVLTKAYNGDWTPDYYNTSQHKWFPYFKVLSSGFGFSGAIYSYGSTYAAVGSRLCFETEEKAAHAGKTFTKLFEEFITAKY
jgi:hypothetical protein